eukprot:scaffold128_cov248-Pinguiococcus_pyrenoidosus.AAC.22
MGMGLCTSYLAPLPQLLWERRACRTEQRVVHACTEDHRFLCERKTEPFRRTLSTYRGTSEQSSRLAFVRTALSTARSSTTGTAVVCARKAELVRIR